MKTTFLIISLFTISFQYLQAQNPIKIKESTTKHGPEKGSLIIIGGGKVPPPIWEKFTELAGGTEHAKIVVITAASGDSAAYRTSSIDLIKKETGVQHVTLLHAENINEANDATFLQPLKEATGVFFVGGRQWRIADAYLNTLAHQAFFDVLDRGGVIAGTSAGASIQGSLLWRGDTKGAHILVGDHTQGLAFLKNSVIDQHLLKRNRQFDLIETVKNSPELIGLGLDESTAVLIRKDSLEVLGSSYVAIYDHNQVIRENNKAENARENYAGTNGSFFFLSNGQKYDLERREIIEEQKKE